MFILKDSSEPNGIAVVAPAATGAETHAGIVIPLQPRYLAVDLSALDAQELLAVLPDGVELPASIPERVFRTAMDWYDRMQRVDVAELARATGHSRRTLYRRIGNRDALLGEIHWYTTRVALAASLAATSGLSGAARMAGIFRCFLAAVLHSPPLIHQLENESANTLRLLTSPSGPVRPRVHRFICRVLEQEIGRGEMSAVVDPKALAHVIALIGESVLYSRSLGIPEQDLDHSVAMVQRLLHDESPSSPPTC